MIVCVLQLYACVVLVIHLCNHVITSDYISIPCGLVIALYCTRYIFEYCLVTVVPCRVQGPSFITNWRRGLTGRMTSTAGGEGEPPAAPAAAAVSAGPLGLYGVVATFDPNKDDWCEYIERLEHYFSANDIASPAKRRAILLTAVGASTYRLIRTLVSPTQVSEVSFADIVDRAKAHFNPKPSPIVKRFEFNTRRQKENESIAVYVAELRKLAEYCEYGATLSDMLRDRLVCGILDRTVQRRLLQQHDLTFDKALEIALTSETAEKDSERLNLSYRP